MRQRKLLAKKVLIDIQLLIDIGVPLRKIIRDKRLDISQPSVTKLLKWFKLSQLPASENAYIITLSLFPKWLNTTSKESQESDQQYNGYFPFGEWA